ncbi:hypothetical protein AKJ16_DCAP14296, partial [Drosera capensis]
LFCQKQEKKQVARGGFDKGRTWRGAAGDGRVLIAGPWGDFRKAEERARSSSSYENGRFWLPLAFPTWRSIDEDGASLTRLGASRRRRRRSSNVSRPMTKGGGDKSDLVYCDEGKGDVGVAGYDGERTRIVGEAGSYRGRLFHGLCYTKMKAKAMTRNIFPFSLAIFPTWVLRFEVKPTWIETRARLLRYLQK